MEQEKKEKVNTHHLKTERSQQEAEVSVEEVEEIEVEAKEEAREEATEAKEKTEVATEAEVEEQEEKEVATEAEAIEEVEEEDLLTEVKDKPKDTADQRTHTPNLLLEAKS